VTRTRLPEQFFLVLSAAFILSLGLAPYPGDALFKVAPIVCLLLAVSLTPGASMRRWIMLALILSGCGDVLLELGYFVPGLGAFLVAHLFYLCAFCRNLRFTLPGLFVVAAMIFCSLAFSWLLTPHLGELQLAVSIYMLVIVGMATAAILGRGNHAWVAAGALLFVVSDSLIAYNRFVEPIPGARYWIMLTYYAAQYYLTWDARAQCNLGRISDNHVPG